MTLILRYLKGGKSPKEIAYIMNKPYDTIRKAILRHEQAYEVYVDTYPLRYPERPAAPPRFKLAV